MIKSTIVDPRVRLRPSKKLLDLLKTHMEHFKELPTNIAKVLKSNGYDVPKSIKLIEVMETTRPSIDMKLLKKLTADAPDEPIDTKVEDDLPQQAPTAPAKGSFLYLVDLHWINNTLIKLRANDICDVYLYEIIESCELILPENEMKPRNPELEERCQRLRNEQKNREYHQMTKNVDAGLKNYPEDTIAYQVKSLNKQIIAVVQFIFSVVAGFFFGFTGINLVVGGMQFGLRLLLGVMAALIIAIAEMYFLAKKLHEYDEVLDSPKHTKSNLKPTTSGVQNVKLHSE